MIRHGSYKLRGRDTQSTCLSEVVLGNSLRSSTVVELISRHSFASICALMR
jgi:hypothetical protein